MQPKYPEIEVQLTGQNGNAFVVMGLVNSALRRCGVSKTERDLFMEEAISGDYNNVLQTAMRWVNVK